LRPRRHAGRSPHRRARRAAGFAGHEHLRARGHKHSWGLGRHVEGSQLFDYWRDPFGHKIEHWTDGDMVNDSYTSHRVPMDPGRLAQWAPPINAEFFE
jgi:hypothetical protein